MSNSIKLQQVINRENSHTIHILSLPVFNIVAQRVSRRSLWRKLGLCGDKIG